MSKLEYKLEFESDKKDILNILEKITEIFSSNLKDKMINPMPTITIIEE